MPRVLPILSWESHYKVQFKLFSTAWLKAATQENICSGFCSAGIVPFNPDAIVCACGHDDVIQGETGMLLLDEGKENNSNGANTGVSFTEDKLRTFAA